MNCNFLLICILCALHFPLELFQYKPLCSSLFPAPSFSTMFPVLPLQLPQCLSYILPARQEMTQAGWLGSIHMLLSVQHHKPDFQGSAGCVSWKWKNGHLSQARGSQLENSWKTALSDQPQCITHYCVRHCAAPAFVPSFVGLGLAWL